MSRQSDRATRIGVFGGTFDPIHNAHLFIAEEARVRAQLDRVLFVVSARPPHKEEAGRTDAEHRAAMTELAVRDNPHFEVSRIEIERPGPSYTLYTLLALQERFPEAELVYLIGMDAIAALETWHRPDEVIRAARFLAVSRPGFDPTLLEGLPADYRAQIDLLETIPFDLSSTDLRRRMSLGLPVRYLIPDPVLEYIARHGLYCG